MVTATCPSSLYVGSRLHLGPESGEAWRDQAERRVCATALPGNHLHVRVGAELRRGERRRQPARDADLFTARGSHRSRTVPASAYPYVRFLFLSGIRLPPMRDRLDVLLYDTS